MHISWPHFCFRLQRAGTRELHGKFEYGRFCKARWVAAQSIQLWSGPCRRTLKMLRKTSNIEHRTLNAEFQHGMDVPGEPVAHFLGIGNETGKRG